MVGSSITHHNRHIKGNLSIAIAWDKPWIFLALAVLANLR